eukprot:jgi/Botrbrau1/12200/Bobra.0186s0105.1
MPFFLNRRKRSGRVWVVVLGDFGRSPRMQYHTLSLARQAGLAVDVIAEGDTAPLDDILQHRRITIHTLPELPQCISRLPPPLALMVKAVLQALMLLCLMLFWLPMPDCIFLQVPPAIPTMAVCWLAAQWHCARFIIDWHNFAYTLMSLNPRHRMIKLARTLEKVWGRTADYNFCVTMAMQNVLERRWGIQATVFYDRPPAHFRPASLEERHTLLLKLKPLIALPLHPRDCHAGQPLPQRGADGAEEPGRTDDAGPGPLAAEVTVATWRAAPGEAPRLREDRPALIVSSTSWTPDEDFRILLEAAMLYDAQASRAGADYPRLLIFVTGKGPQKEQYLQQMQGLDLRRVAFRTLWLESADYPRLLGSCDLGVSLHTSSSGYDLPMKVVDMFGCGLPVCAYKYDCIEELVANEKAGLLFSTPKDLARHFLRLFLGFPQQDNGLAEMRRNVAASVAIGWDASWANRVQPVFIGAPRAAPRAPAERLRSRGGSAGTSSSVASRSSQVRSSSRKAWDSSRLADGFPFHMRSLMPHARRGLAL